jgi:hypothetical protein
VDESGYGLIVEGTYDEAVFSELVRKIVSPKVELVVRPCGGVPQLMKRSPGFLREFEHVIQGRPVDKALVIRDCNGGDPDSLERTLAHKIRNQHYAFPRGVHFHAVKREIETWLLAGIHAINSLAQERGGRVVPAEQRELEAIAGPKTTLTRLLLRAGALTGTELPASP